jgi:hypothetical protein
LGTPLTESWCLNASLKVNSSAYHSAHSITVPPYQLERAWINRRSNFDNILMAVWTLFSISTTELWIDALNAGKN